MQMPGLGTTSSSRDNFTLSSTDNEFKSRTEGVFASLDSIERQHASHERSRSRSDDSRTRSRSPDELDHEGWSRRDRFSNQRHQVRGSRSRPWVQVDDRHTGFRRPSNRPPRRPYVPDFRRNPQNYTEYDLSSVADHSERSNTSAALSFLDDLRKRKENETGEDRRQQSDYETNPSKARVWGTDSKYMRRKHSFTRRDKSSDDTSDDPQPSTSRSTEEVGTEKGADQNTGAKFVDGKLTMPEYVIGREKVNRKERKVIKGERLTCDALSLDHLSEDSSSKEDEANIGKEEKPELKPGEEKNKPDEADSSESSSEKKGEKVQFKKVKRKASTRKRDDNSDE